MKTNACGKKVMFRETRLSSVRETCPTEKKEKREISLKISSDLE
jgi:hypothetical protein